MTIAMNNACPRISILMAVYNPRIDWLEEQLYSLNAQTYPNINLYVRDDFSDEENYRSMCALTEKIITAFPFSITRNTANLGSNKTFELLTEEADGAYFAYCDQDDVWLPEKLSVLAGELEKEKAELVCSDMYIIDTGGSLIADSFTKFRKNQHFMSGFGLAPKLLVYNFVTGCAMLIRSETARAALPFCPYIVHDQYLALFAADRGKIVSLPQSLIKYRRHGSNQTATMSGVSDRESYYRLRIEKVADELSWLDAHFSGRPETMRALRDAICWLDARKSYFNGDRTAAKELWKFRHFNRRVTFFELALPFMSERAFRTAIMLKKENFI